jgi:WD40 repeat protein
MFKLAGPRIECLAFDPTGPRLVTASATGDVSLWSVLSGKRLRRMREIGEPVSAVAASPDGRLLAAGSRTGELQVWKVASGELVHQMRGHCTRIQGLEFDSASQRIAVACADGVVVIDDVASGLPSVVLSGSRGSVRMARFSPDGGRVVAPSNDGTARIWDTASAYSRWRSGAVADDCGVIRTPDPDRRFIADACRDSPTRIWDVALGKMIAELPAVTHVDGGFASAFPVVSADGSRAAIARGHLVAIYEVPSGKLLRTVQHAAAVNSVAFAPSGHDLISGAVDGGLVVTRDAGAVLSLPAMAAGVDAVGLLADGRAVVADASHHLRVYDQLGAIVGELVLPGRSSFLRETDGHLVTVPIDPTYETKASSPTLIGLRTYTVIAQLDKHIGRVFSARWVRGHRVLTAGMDGTARMWDGLTGAELQVFRSGARFLADATLRDDDTVIATGADGTVRFWEAGSGRLLWAMQAHRASIGVLHVDGNAFVTRAFDGEIAGWVLPDPGEVLRSCEARAGCDTVD